MANRVISVETKVKVMQECLRLVNVEEVAARHGVSARAIYGWYTLHGSFLDVPVAQLFRTVMR